MVVVAENLGVVVVAAVVRMGVERDRDLLHCASNWHCRYGA